MIMPIHWGILGTGAMAAAFARELRALPDAVVAAVGSRSVDAAAKFASHHGIPRHRGSYREVVSDPEIDVVYIATVNSTHCELCLECLDAGKAVLCEKPFALNAFEARQIAERARERQLFCMEAMWMRFLPAIGRLKKLINEGVIGTPRMLAAQLGYPFKIDPGGRHLDPAVGGGALLDLGVYPLSLACFLFGPPLKVAGQATYTTSGVDDANAIVLQHPDDRLSVISVNMAAAASNDATIMGTRGRIQVSAPFFHPQSLTIHHVAPIVPMSGARGGRFAKLKKSAIVRWVYRRLAPGLPARWEDLPYEGEGYRYEAAEVMRCLRAGERESTTMPLDESVVILETIDELRRQWK
jgi:predicted dehydrogenase